VNGNLKFLSKYLADVPKSPPNTSEFPKLEYSSQLVTRVPREIPQNGRRPTQQTEYDLELKRSNCRQYRNHDWEKLDRKTSENLFNAKIETAGRIWARTATWNKHRPREQLLHAVRSGMHRPAQQTQSKGASQLMLW
jgi:hypothetical protein